MSPPLLAHPDSSRPFYVLMDASDYAVEGYLYQHGYHDRKLHIEDQPTRSTLISNFPAATLLNSYFRI
ncbi:RNase H-like domain found in reverse transcriptase [Phytophthora infestans]|uniref:RNase H-like domain found in reverse transcriptase n=1 Tax=Phytophthora infestans TaxID=4787 RepID=A0A833SJR9_PHYIN|nr:RNase H-like domain found in reverse transcriptase [Phytophthora infestans]